MPDLLGVRLAGFLAVFVPLFVVGLFLMAQRAPPEASGKSPPPIHFLHGILDQLIDPRAAKGKFLAVKMAVVSLTSLALDSDTMQPPPRP